MVLEQAVDLHQAADGGAVDVADGLVQRSEQRSEVPLLVAALVQPEEVRDGLRLVELRQHPRLQGRRGLVQRGCRCDSESGEQEKAVHAIGLP